MFDKMMAGMVCLIFITMAIWSNIMSSKIVDLEKRVSVMEILLGINK